MSARRISNVELENKERQLGQSNKFDLVKRSETGADRLKRIFLTYATSIVFRTVQTKKGTRELIFKCERSGLNESD